MVPWNEPKVTCVPSPLAVTMWMRSKVKASWAPVNRPVPLKLRDRKSTDRQKSGTPDVVPPVAT